MSKTDKTKPWLVRVSEHHPWAVHDHRNGICDLPDHPLAVYRSDERYVRERGGCRWSDWNLCYDGCCHGCGCRTCSGYWWRREARRRDRHESRRSTRALLKGAEW